MTDWLTVQRGQGPVILSLPHTGTLIPPDIEARLVSGWLARKDCDWWIDRLYDFAGAMNITIVHTAMSRTVIDVNRDPSGVSLYPGQATTELCPLTTFDGEPLYHMGEAPQADEIADRQARWFDPYHAALSAEIDRLKAIHGRVVLYDAHSIRSRIPRLFEGDLPVFNIGTNGGTACAPVLAERIAALLRPSPYSVVIDGRFKGGFITRRYGRPADGVHAIQMELACRGYLDEPLGPVTPETWPVAYDPLVAGPARVLLGGVLSTAIHFAFSGS
jgi:formiminoglutamase